MKYEHGTIHDLVIKKLNKFVDERGWLSELFRTDELPPELMPSMCYISGTKPGVARGPHEHRDQADNFCFVGPSMFRLYCWDARKESPSYGKKTVLEVGSENPVTVIVPAGVVHAYLNIGDVEGWIINLPNRLYAGKGRSEPVDEIRHENNPDTPFRLE